MAVPARRQQREPFRSITHLPLDASNRGRRPEALTGLPMFLSNSAPENVMPPPSVGWLEYLYQMLFLMADLPQGEVSPSC